MARKCIEERHKVLLGPLPHRLGEDRYCKFSKRRGEWLRREPPGYLTHHSNKDRFAGLLKALSEDLQA